METLSPFVTLASFTLRSSTPLLLGGYDSYACHGGGFGCEPLRTQSLKGVLRWWSRAALAGALYASGVNNGQLLSKVRSVEREIWGSVEGVSPVKIRTRGVLTSERFMRLSQHSRYKLLRLARFPRGKVLYGFLSRGEVYVQRYAWDFLAENLVNHAVLSLIAMLWLGGLGKGSRRGLGSLDILAARNVDSRYIRPESVAEVLKRLMAASRGLLGSFSPSGGEGLPPIPAIAKGVFRLFRCEVREPLGAAVAFSNCVLGRRMRDRTCSWIFGLPRRGYQILDRGVERRASPIMFSSHRGVGFISAFYSSDWPRRIRRRGSVINIDDEGISEKMDCALGHLVDCLSTAGVACREVRIW